MSTFSIILLVLVFGMGIALYFQMKAGRKQSADQAQLLQAAKAAGRLSCSGEEFR